MYQIINAEMIIKEKNKKIFKTFNNSNIIKKLVKKLKFDDVYNKASFQKTRKNSRKKYKSRE